MTHMATAPGADVHLARVPHKAPSYIARHGPWVFGLRFQTLAAAVTAKGTNHTLWLLALSQGYEQDAAEQAEPLPPSNLIAPTGPLHRKTEGCSFVDGCILIHPCTYAVQVDKSLIVPHASASFLP